MELTLPVLPLRKYQLDIWNKLMLNNIKKSFLVWHRRAGKDLFSLQYMVAKAYPEVGNYWYILPQQNQVRRAIWEGVTKGGFKYLDMIPKELIYKKKDDEMKIILRNPNNYQKEGSIISFLGGDRYDSLVGSGIKGAVISEFALQRPNLFDLVLEPMLRETNGWALFNTTPRGENHAHAMFEFLKSEPKYLTSLLTIEDTNILNPEDLEEERRRGKPEEIIQQEYYCSFAGAVFGSYYADVLKKSKYGNYPYDSRYQVYTMWDLGVSDSTTIWFLQFIDRKPRLIDYYENSGYGYAHYAQIVLNKEYNYACHYLPHDGNNRKETPTEIALSPKTQLLQLGLNKVDVIPRTSDVIADINSVRGIIPMCEFDEKTKLGYESLKQYHKKYDENRKTFLPTPDHDWSSHGSDAFRMLPALEKKILAPKITMQSSRSWDGQWS